MISNVFSNHLNISFYLANSGIPLFTQSIRYQFFLGIPIVAIEAYIHRRTLNLTITRSISLALSTNIISTIGGGISLMILSHTVLGFNIIPYAYPILPLELMVTLIPMFIMSYLLESFIGRLVLKKIEKSKIDRSFLIGNIFTYVMLEVLAVTLLIKGYFIT